MLDGRSLEIFAIYAPSHGNNVIFFNELRKSQLDSKEQFQIITGDLNTTLDPELDKLGYISDNHWKTREVINSWLDDDHHGLIDAYRYCNPERKQYTWKNKSLKQQARLDYILISQNLAHCLKSSHIDYCPWQISDHNPCYANFQFETVVEGPGTFRCAYGMSQIPEYNLMVKHLLHESVTDICNKGVIEKALEHANNRIIYNLSICQANNNITPEQSMILGISLSLQQTKAELLAGDIEIGNDVALDYVIKKVANATKIFQRECKRQKTEVLDKIKD